MKTHRTTVTRKGQVTIPSEIRRALHLEEGDAVAWVLEGDHVRLSPARFSLESAFASVEPRRRPEDFEELERTAKDAKARSADE